MPAVNWDEPSDGSVSDSSPALTLNNDQGSALAAASAGVAVSAESSNAEAVVGQTRNTFAARFTSDNSIAIVGHAPKLFAGIAVNQVGNAAALAGSNTTDPAAPQGQNGIGVMGITDRPRAIGVAGYAMGTRSTGVVGEAVSGLGVSGVGTEGGVEGSAIGGPGVAGFTESPVEPGVYGFGSGLNSAGVRGEGVAGPGIDAHSTAGPGVRALSEQAEGVIAEAKAPNAAGIRGRNDHQDGVGVDAFSQDGTALRATASSGIAVSADSFSNRAVDASTFSQDEPAIYASALAAPALKATTGGGAAVDAFGLTGTGVLGSSSGATDPADPKKGVGVFGRSLSGVGVYGWTLGGTGVVGLGHPLFGALAGYFLGNVVVHGDMLVNGSIFKQCCFFSIDHPLDPKRKLLNHAAVESSEYKTFYDGVATLDSRGQARVRLPRWFEALNRDLRYQLTPIGASAHDLHVAQEVKGGTFVIAGGSPRQKVCWQVTGVRQDKWATEHPMEVEPSKRTSRRPAPPKSEVPTPEDIQNQAEALKQAASARKTESAARERAVKTRRPQAPLTAPKVPEPPTRDGMTAQVAERIRETTQRVIKRA